MKRTLDIPEGPIDRDLGLMRADISVHLLHDPKVLRLHQRLPDEHELAVTVLVYMETLLASWREGRRLSAEEAAGLWRVTADRVNALSAVGLLDADGRIPMHAWARWFEPARARIERRREAGRKAGRRSGVVRARNAATSRGGSKPSSSGRSTSVQRPPTIAEPSQPPPPTVAGGAGGAGAMDWPSGPRVDMSDLGSAETDAIERMLAGLHERDGRRRLLGQELRRREISESTGSIGASGAKA